MENFRGQLGTDGIGVFQIGEDYYRRVIVGIPAYLRRKAVNGTWMDHLEMTGHGPRRRAA
jgi:hypothetical protein